MRFKAIKSLKIIKYSSLIINRRRTQGNKQKSNNSTNERYRDYIEKGDEDLKESRLLALETVLK